jgi:nucleotide-binding universal stress UspA family protein
MPETIIVGVDPRRGDDTRDAIALAALLAPVAGAELLVVTVLEPSRAVDVGRYERDLARDVRDTAAHLTEPLGFEVRAMAGSSPARVLHELAERMHAAALVIGASLSDPDDGWLAGGVADLLLHGGATPVIVVPHGFAGRGRGGLEVIGAGYLDTADGREALRHAARLALACGAQVRAISVVEPFLFSHIAMARDHEGLAVEHALAQRARTALDEAVRALPSGIRATDVLLEGSPAPTLTRLSADLDLLVLGSRAYGPEGAVLPGPVSRAVAQRAACPVMIVPRARAVTPEAAAARAVPVTAGPER